MLNIGRKKKPKVIERFFGPDHFTGWPETPSLEQLERAIEGISQGNWLTPKDPEKEHGRDDRLLKDIILCLVSIENCNAENRIDPSYLNALKKAGNELMLWEILVEEERLGFFTGAIMLDEEGKGAGLNTPRGSWDVFALLRREGWMGLAPGLANLKGKHVYASESQEKRGRVAAFMAWTEPLGNTLSSRVHEPTEGEGQRLQEIALWHGALSFTWWPCTW